MDIQDSNDVMMPGGEPKGLGGGGGGYLLKLSLIRDYTHTLETYPIPNCLLGHRNKMQSYVSLEYSTPRSK